VAEGGFGSYVKPYKPWFIGREAFVAREKERKGVVVRFRFDEQGVRMAHNGDPVVNASGERIGWVTSCAIETEEEVRAAIREGEEAVIALVASLVKVIEVLATRQQALEDQIAKNSRNSGKPPSSDGYDRPAPKSLRKRSRKKSGGQAGHIGYTLKAVEKPEHVEVHRVEQCSHCHSSLWSVQKSIAMKSGKSLMCRRCKWK
jgi:hypothetical protein